MAFKSREDPEVIQMALEAPQELVERVWAAYVHAHSGSKGRRLKLTDSRRDTIRVAIVKYGADRSIKAILGVLYSEWHMGENPLGKVYNSLELILRDEWRVSKFNRLYDQNSSNHLTVVEEYGRIGHG